MKKSCLAQSKKSSLAQLKKSSLAHSKKSSLAQKILQKKVLMHDLNEKFNTIIYLFLHL